MKIKFPSWPWLTFRRGVVILAIMNLIDAASTHMGLHMGIVYEVNPLMRWAYGVSPAAFWSLKMGLVSGGLLVIGSLASEALARRTALNAILLYLLVIFAHVYGWLSWALS